MTDSEKGEVFSDLSALTIKIAHHIERMEWDTDIDFIERVFYALLHNVREQKTAQPIRMNIQSFFLSMDVSGYLVIANNSAHGFLNYPWIELQKQHFTFLISENVCNEVEEWLSPRLLQNINSSFTVSTKCATGGHVNAFWELNWSADKKLFFGIIQEVVELEDIETFS